MFCVYVCVQLIETSDAAPLLYCVFKHKQNAARRLPDEWRAAGWRFLLLKPSGGSFQIHLNSTQTFSVFYGFATNSFI